MRHGQPDKPFWEHHQLQIPNDIFQLNLVNIDKIRLHKNYFKWQGSKHWIQRNWSIAHWSGSIYGFPNSTNIVKFNRIQSFSISEKAFAGLRTLDLKFSRLELPAIKPGTFAGIDRIWLISFIKCKIGTIHTEALTIQLWDTSNWKIIRLDVLNQIHWV